MLATTFGVDASSSSAPLQATPKVTGMKGSAGLPFTDDPLIVVGTVPEQRVMAGSVFPLVLSPRSPLRDFAQLRQWIEEHRDELMKAMRDFGAVLLRGFESVVQSPREFSDVVEALGVEPLPYVGGAAPRTCVYKDVFTSNESPPSQKIPFHHEMAQVPTYPTWIFFYSQVAATEGGATPILRSDVLYDTVNERMPEFCRKLELHGVRYTRVMPDQDDPDSPIGRGWRSTFQTDDRAVAEQKAAGLGVQLVWLDSEEDRGRNAAVKSVSGVLPAIKPYMHDPARKVFFNSMVAAYTGWRDVRNDPLLAVTYGNGDLLAADDMEQVAAIMEEVCVAMPWRDSDILCIDNNLCMHSRQSFVPPRRLLAYVAK